MPKFNKEHKSKLEYTIFNLFREKLIQESSPNSLFDIDAILASAYEYEKEFIINGIYNDTIKTHEELEIINGIFADIYGIPLHGTLSFLNDQGEIVELANRLIVGHSEEYVKRTAFIYSSFNELFAEFHSLKMLDEQNGTSNYKLFIEVFGQEFYDFINDYWEKTIEGLVAGQNSSFASLSKDEIVIYSMYLKSFDNLVDVKNLPKVNEIKIITLNYNNVVTQNGKFNLDDLIQKIKFFPKNITLQIDCSKMDEASIQELGAVLLDNKNVDINNLNLILPANVSYNFETVLLNKNNVYSNNGEYGISLIYMARDLSNNSQVIIDGTDMSLEQIQELGAKILDSYTSVNVKNIKVLQSDGNYYDFASVLLNQNNVDSSNGKIDMYDLISKIENIRNNTSKEIIVDIRNLEFKDLKNLLKTLDRNKIKNVVFLEQNGQNTKLTSFSEMKKYLF